MYICHCRAVTDRRICEAIEAGASDSETINRRCGAGGACGGCLPALQAMLAHYGLTGPAAGIPVDAIADAIADTLADAAAA